MSHTVIVEAPNEIKVVTVGVQGPQGNPGRSAVEMRSNGMWVQARDADSGEWYNVFDMRYVGITPRLAEE